MCDRHPHFPVGPAGSVTSFLDSTPGSCSGPLQGGFIEYDQVVSGGLTPDQADDAGHAAMLSGVDIAVILSQQFDLQGSEVGA